MSRCPGSLFKRTAGSEAALDWTRTLLQCTMDRQLQVFGGLGVSISPIICNSSVTIDVAYSQTSRVPSKVMITGEINHFDITRMSLWDRDEGHK